MRGNVLEVVWIAPELGARLEWMDELGQIAQLPGVNVIEVCGKQVGRTEICNALNGLKDVVIWSGHARYDEKLEETVLPVSRGRPVRGKWLATQCMAAAPLVFIGAACGTARAGGHLEKFISPFSAAGINAVGFPAATDDEAAGVYLVEFVRAMRAKRDVGRAHEVALTESIQEDTATAQGVILKPAMTNGMRDFVDRMTAFDTRLTTMELLTRRMADHMGVL